MPTVHKELLKTIRQTTRGGSTWSVVMECMVTDLDGSGYAEGEKFQITDDADVELRAEGFTPGSMCPEHANLVLADMELEAIDTDKVKAYLTYVHRSEYEFQDLTNPPNGKLWFNNESGLVDTETEVDGAGDGIILTYEYPAGDKWFDGETRDQGGRVQVKIPTKVKTLRGIIPTNDPDNVVDNLLWHVNDSDWQGGGAHHWLCTQANYYLFNDETEPPKYAFDFRWEYNYDDWRPTAVAVHEGTGKIPGDWEDQPLASATIEWYPTTDFAEFFSMYGIWGTD